MSDAFQIRLENDISWRLMPLGLKPPIDPISYIAKTSKNATKHRSATKQFLAALTESFQAVEGSGGDAGRLLTIFHVRLESVKKIEKADLTVGIAGDKAVEDVGPMIVTRVRDPNVTHPLKQKQIMARIGSSLHGMRFTTNTFYALAHKFKYRSDPRYCWSSADGTFKQYSADLIQHIKNLSKEEIQDALNEYRKRTTNKSAQLSAPHRRKG